MNQRNQKAAAREFARKWAGKGYEKGESQQFWIGLLGEVFGIENPWDYMQFEEKVKLDHTSFIDIMIPSTRVMIEQKSIGKFLGEQIKQSDGKFLSAFGQAKRYLSELPLSRHPRWIVTCNFREFWIYDMESPSSDPKVVLLENLEQDYPLLEFLVNESVSTIEREKEVSLQAGEMVGRLYDLLLAQYLDPTSPQTLHELNKLCVRLVFCLYAEDAGIFARDAFARYLKPYMANPAGARRALIELFAVLDTPLPERDPYMEPALLEFPYVNGSLFAGSVEVPRFTPELLTLLIDKASLGFDWSMISPTIFGGVFESTLNPDTRREGGMHYTSVENIHRVINPLFLNELERELNEIIDNTPAGAKLERRLTDFRRKLASLRFFDPACGSGNFLTETYLSLRRLENEALRRSITDGSVSLFSPIMVNINQFYGVEINDFAVSVARTALWIAESQMMKQTEDIVAADLDFLPLKHYENIRHANALTLDWNQMLGGEAKPSFIIGNPPFFGARLMTPAQKQDMLEVFGSKWPNLGNLDYVAAWYKKCADFMAGTSIRAALVSTNSITQGEQVAALWKPLLDAGISIDFAYRTFRWDSESNQKAHVHCVIIAFSYFHAEHPRIFDGDQVIPAANINPYLIDAPNRIVESRTTPIADVPPMEIGNQPIDDGNYLFTREEMQAFVAAEPKSKPYFRPWYGAQEFISQKPRYCLWLGDCSPAELRAMPLCLKRVAAVREFRQKSKRKQTQKCADTPTRFYIENIPQSTYLLVPSTSSERRQYIPMGFMSPEALASNAVLIVPNATLYHFGVLTSRVHMAWMRTVAGRLEMRYRYSANIVYNNFPWPDADQATQERIAALAQAVLDARALYPDSSLADLYDTVAMPAELRRAHTALDSAVLRAYGMPPDAPDPAIVQSLLR